MTDGVKFIFKTLLKVPIYIVVAFGIFNIFAFCFIYFRMLGVSYVVQQTAIENNYLPKQQVITLMNYIGSISNIEMVDHVGIIIGQVGDDADYADSNDINYVFITQNGFNAADPASSTYFCTKGGSAAPTVNALQKRQYGGTVTVGVCARYKFVWPLDHATVDGIGGPSGNDGSQTNAGRDTSLNKGNMADNLDVNQLSGTEAGEQGYDNTNIVITYKVPGLKYYPDLLT